MPCPERGKGISVFQFDDQTGDLTLASEYLAIDNPGYLAIDEKRKRLYAAVEIPAWNENMAVAFDIDPATGALSYINMQSTLGNTTCHLGFDQTGELIFASNYTVAELGARPGNAVAAFCRPCRWRAGSRLCRGDPRRPECRPANGQAPAWPLRCGLARTIAYVFVCDLGLDRIMAYTSAEDRAKEPVRLRQHRLRNCQMEQARGT